MKNPKDWNEDTIFALLPYKRVLNSVGSWPLDLQNARSLLLWTIILIIQISTSVTMSLEIHRHCHRVEDEIESFAVDVFAVIGILKHMINRFDWRRRVVLLESLIEDWASVKDSVERGIMLEYAKKGRFVLECYLSMFCVSMVTLFIARIPVTILFVHVNNASDTGYTNRPFMVEASCVFGSPPILLYLSILFLQVVQLISSVLVHCGLDATIFGLLMHLCGQFEVLKRSFVNIRTDDTSYQKRIGVLIRRHCQLADFGDRMEEAFSIFILVQVGTSAIFLCVEGFQLIASLNANDKITATKHVIFIITILIQIYLYAFAGNTLELITGDLVHSIYSAPWYNFERNVMKAVPLMIMRAKTPHYTTAGKFIVMNHESFKDILKASISYISLLRVLINFN